MKRSAMLFSHSRVVVGWLGSDLRLKPEHDNERGVRVRGFHRDGC